jgi:tetratricopeptide (TPR) repeat protein
MIRKAVDLRPDDGYIVDSLGWAYYRLNRFDDAVGELERAVELKAADSTINDHLGDAYWRVGRKLEAIFQWKTALEVKPDEAEVPKIKKKIKEGLPPIEADAGKTTVTPTKEVTVAQADPVKQPGVEPVQPTKQEPVEPVTEEKPAQPVTDEKPAQPVTEEKPVEPVTEEKPATTTVVTPAEIPSHTVVKGDSLWNIAKDLLGDGMRFHDIIELNPEFKRHPDRLQPGQILKLPGKN